MRFDRTLPRLADPLDGRQCRRPQDPSTNLRPAKDKSTERIDGIVAPIMAIGRALVAQDQLQPMFFRMASQRDDISFEGLEGHLELSAPKKRK